MKLTENELFELRYHYVDRYVDNMSTKDLVQYVFDDMLRYVESQPDAEFLDEAENYWEDSFGEVVDEIQDYIKTPFKKPLREPFEETN